MSMDWKAPSLSHCSGTKHLWGRWLKGKCWRYSDVHFQTWPQRSEEAIIVAQETEASKPSRLLKTVELNKFEVRFNEQISCNAKQEIVSALQRPDWTSSTTHRAGTPVLKSPGSHPVSNQELSPTEVQASETKTTIQEEGEDLGFSPGFNKVLSDFETTISAFELEKKLPRKAAESLDSDTEYFDCEQTLSDFSEAEEVFPAGGFAFRISEPPSPMPGSSQGLGLVTASPECRRHPFLRVQDYKRFSSGSESLGDFAYDSDCSKECRSEDDFPLCEELPSRDQAGNVDDKEDFLARVRSHAWTESWKRVLPVWTNCIASTCSRASGLATLTLRTKWWGALSACVHRLIVPRT